MGLVTVKMGCSHYKPTQEVERSGYKYRTCKEEHSYIHELHSVQLSTCYKIETICPYKDDMSLQGRYVLMVGSVHAGTNQKCLGHTDWVSWIQCAHIKGHKQVHRYKYH